MIPCYSLKLPSTSLAIWILIAFSYSAQADSVGLQRGLYSVGNSETKCFDQRALSDWGLFVSHFLGGPAPGGQAMVICNTTKITRLGRDVSFEGSCGVIEQRKSYPNNLLFSGDGRVISPTSATLNIGLRIKHKDTGQWKAFPNSRTELRHVGNC